MRKNYFGRQFKRDTNERKALFKGLLSALVLREKIITTEAKAKAIKPSADKLITKAKKDTLLAKKLLAKELTPEASIKVIDVIAPRFAKRSGGYTRIIKLDKRLSDNAPMVIIEWTEKESQISPASPSEAGRAKIKSQSDKTDTDKMEKSVEIGKTNRESKSKGKAVRKVKTKKTETVKKGK